VITCVLNSEKYLPECIRSVNNQTYKNFEQLFVYGPSRDRTWEIIRCLSPGARIICSSDESGIYPAINKGLQSAAGDIVGFLHSDDIFADDQALARVAAAFEKNKNLDYYCSRMLIGGENLANFFAALGARPHRRKFGESLYSSNYFAHPTYYCRRSVIDEVGPYDARYKIAADIDWLIRLEKTNCRWYFDSQPLIKFRSSKKSLSSKKYFSALKEELEIRIKYDGVSISLIVVYAYHFFRRSVRYVLEKAQLDYLIDFFRKIIIKLS